MSKNIPQRAAIKRLQPLAVIRQPHTAEARYISQSGLCGICGEKRGTEIICLFPVSIIPPILHTHVNSSTVDSTGS